MIRRTPQAYIFNDGSFFSSQVRFLAGTLIEVGRGEVGPEEIPRIIAAKARSAAGRGAAAKGLCLEEVLYDRKPEGSS